MNNLTNLKRRHFIQNSGLSLGAMALGMMNASGAEKKSFLTHAPNALSHFSSGCVQVLSSGQ